MANNNSVLLSSTLTPTRGFHTSSTTRLVLRGSHPHSCTLHLYFELPAQLFADPYELDHRRRSYTFERFGGGNLEAPVFAPGAGGPSGLLLNVNARYGVPKRDGEQIDEVALQPPEVFWACPRERADGDGDGGERMQIPDVLHKVIKLAPALERASRLVLIPHAEAVQAQVLRVPVGYTGDVMLVEIGTVVVVLLTFVYLLRTIVRASRAQDVGVKTSVAKKDT